MAFQRLETITSRSPVIIIIIMDGLLYDIDLEKQASSTQGGNRHRKSVSDEYQLIIKISYSHIILCYYLLW